MEDKPQAGFLGYPRVEVQHQQHHKGLRVSIPRAKCSQVTVSRVAREQQKQDKQILRGHKEPGSTDGDTETEGSLVCPRDLSGLPW